MKKAIKLLTVPFALTTTVPFINLTSCAKSKDFYQQMEETILNEFYQICKIPRPSDQFVYEKPYSSNCLNISNYLMKRVQELIGVKVWQDKYANLWFDVPANDESLADAPVIALQAHMDMVFTYDETKFEKAPDPLTYQIEPVMETINGKRIMHSKDYKTSLGADDATGLATILAIIANKNIKHGKLRVIFSNCEENACQGAMMMVKGYTYDDESKGTLPPTMPEAFHGVNNVLNLDAGCDGAVFISASGAIGSHYSKSSASGSVVAELPNKFEVKISGFDGGHSAGAARQNCGNPIVVGSEILARLQGTGIIQIASLETPGATVYNVVPTAYTMRFATDKTKADIQTAISEVIAKHSDTSTEAGKKVYYKDITKAKFEISEASFDKVLAPVQSKQIITLQNSLFYGKDESEEEQKQFIKTSANIGPSTLALNGTRLDYKLSSYSRSDKQEAVEAFKSSNKLAAEQGYFDYLCDAQLPPWKEKENNRMFNIVKDGLIHAGIPQEKITIGRAHGGIECSWWQYAMKEIEKASDPAICLLGVSVADEHKVTEWFNVDDITTNLKAVMYCLENANTLK